MDYREERQRIEEEIAAMADSADAATITRFLEGILDRFTARQQAIQGEIVVLEDDLKATQEIMRHLRVVRTFVNTTGGSAVSAQFNSDMPTWECAEMVLKEAGKPLTAAELAERIERGGKALGDQAPAKVTSGISRHLGKVFSRRERSDGVYEYSLNEWGGDEGEIDVGL